MRPFLPQDLKSPVAEVRADAADSALAAAAGDQLEALRALLRDDAPVLISHAGQQLVTEVRFAALTALQGLYREAGRKPDFGPLEVRKAAPINQVIADARSAVEVMPDAERQELLNRANQELDERVKP